MTIRAEGVGIAAGPLIQRTAQELDTCRAIIARIEAVVLDLISSPGPISALPSAGLLPEHPDQMSATLQDLDLLEQILADLGHYLRGLGNAEPLRRLELVEGMTCLQDLQLDDLRQRLGGSAGPVTRPSKIELF